ncbi:MAG: hypothetical protein GY820_25710 [Gammaproteobacteria bacterium]|nr:hypothetical protein [Gammaproteobacteria bacterium]
MLNKDKTQEIEIQVIIVAYNNLLFEEINKTQNNENDKIKKQYNKYILKHNWGKG